MSGNTERLIEFPICECGIRDGRYWVVYNDNLTGLCLHPPSSLQEHKIYNMEERNLKLSDLDEMSDIRCTGCYQSCSDELVDSIIAVAKQIFDAEWEKYNVR